MTIEAIWDVLVNEELTYEENREGVFIKTRTDKGSAAGIEIVHKIGASGVPYELLKYPENVQEVIVDYFVKGIDNIVEDEPYLDEEITWAKAVTSNRKNELAE